MFVAAEKTDCSGYIYKIGQDTTHKTNNMYKAILINPAINENFNRTCNIGNIISSLSSTLNQQLENYIIEGLKRKGFEFQNKSELENFIKSNCKCEDRTDLNQRTYFVNDTRFLLHCYEVKIDLNLIPNYKGEVKMSVNYGSFAYL